MFSVLENQADLYVVVQLCASTVVMLFVGDVAKLERTVSQKLRCEVFSGAMLLESLWTSPMSHV